MSNNLNLLARVEEFRNIDSHARKVIRDELEKLGIVDRLHLTDFGRMDRNERGYMTHFQTPDGETHVLSVSFEWNNETTADNEVVVAWNPNDPIIDYR